MGLLLQVWNNNIESRLGGVMRGGRVLCYFDMYHPKGTVNIEPFFGLKCALV